jgi:hypothetical protein
VVCVGKASSLSGQTVEPVIAALFVLWKKKKIKQIFFSKQQNRSGAVTQ